MRPFHTPASRTAVVAAAAVVLALGACGGGDDDDEAATTEPSQTEEASAAQDAATHTIELETKDFEFAPAELTAPSCAKVTVKLRNSGAAPHTFTASALGVDEQVAAGENGEASFTMPDSGTVTVVCTFHEAQGMKGAISPA